MSVIWVKLWAVVIDVVHRVVHLDRQYRRCSLYGHQSRTNADQIISSFSFLVLCALSKSSSASFLPLHATTRCRSLARSHLLSFLGHPTLGQGSGRSVKLEGGKSFVVECSW